jgi:hypothetical protein
MPRTKPRSTNKGSWSVAAMNAAMDAVKSGVPVREASRKFDVPRSSLRDRLKAGNCYEIRLGRKATFNPAQETEIANHLLALAKLFYGLTQLQLRNAAFEYATKNGIQNNFNAQKHLAGKDWYHGFMSRNSELSLRQPEATSINRIVAFNKVEVDHFYSNLENLMDIHKFTAAQIFNVDETGISTVHHPSKVLGPKGQKQVGAATSWERGKTVTVCCAMSASGSYIPPFFIFPRQRMTALLERGAPAGSMFGCSKSGWMNEELFLSWLPHFVQHANCSVDRPSLLILDNHSSHISLAIYYFCRDNGVVMLTIPPHTSHRLQPLDVTFYGPLKTAFNRECDLFVKSHPSQKLTHYDLAALFNAAYMRIATIEKAVKGFSTTGIFPMNPNTFTDEDFAPATTLQLQCLAPIPISVTRNYLNDEHNGLPVVENLDVSDQANLESSQLHVSIQEIATIPVPVVKASRQRNPGIREKQHSEILTSTPKKTKYEAVQAKRDCKKRKLADKCDNDKIAKKKAKARPSQTGSKKPAKQDIRPKPTTSARDISSSDSDENMPCIDELALCDDDTDDDVLDEDAGFSGRKVTVAKRSAADYKSASDNCAICGEFGRDKETWYRCTECGYWVHRDCSGADTPKGYVCDHCIANKL